MRFYIMKKCIKRGVPVYLFDYPVPEEIIENRKNRAVARDGKATPVGYLKNAIEDLKKMDFKGKEQVLSVLKRNAGVKTLDGFSLAEAAHSWQPQLDKSHISPPLQGLTLPSQ